MKKAIILLTALFYLGAKAQTNVYHPFPDTSATWNEMYSNGISGCCCSNCTLFFPNVSFLAGDTIISTLHYKKLLSSGYENNGYGNYNYFYNTYIGSIRQDSIHKKVYFCKVSTTIDTLLYDFNLSVGDTLPVSYINSHQYVKNYVSSIDSIMIGTSYRKQYHISFKNSTFLGSDSNYVSLIEGIGSTNGLTYSFPSPPIENGGGTALYCFSQNNITVYTKPYYTCDNTVDIKQATAIKEQISIYPNPATNNIQVTLVGNSENATLVLTDMLGNTVKQENIKTEKTIIDVADLTEGVYNISIIGSKGIINKRLVIVK